MPCYATYFGSNGWLIEFDEFRVLIDPWLTGSLSFPLGSWFFEGKLTNEQVIPKDIDLLLLTQGLADHAHVPTLEKIPRLTKVIGSASAVKVVQRLGFEKVKCLKPLEKIHINKLLVQATAGAAAPNLENGYLLNHPLGSIYLEPHGFLDARISPRRLDAVITPVVNLRLPFAGTFINGANVLPELINRFHPRTILASTIGGDAKFTGLISGYIRMDGSIVEANQIISEGTLLVDPMPGRRYQIGRY